MWHVPAFLIATSLDVGQVVTSHEIRKGKRNWWRYVTFGVFSIATYYLQWTYMSYHMPLLTLSAGVRPDTLAFAQGVRDAAIWLVPALLPMATLLYTFSQADHPQAPVPATEVEPAQAQEPTAVRSPGVKVSKPELPGNDAKLLPAGELSAAAAAAEGYLLCPYCGRPFKSTGGLGKHMLVHMPQPTELVTPDDGGTGSEL
jgi:hypothetical protein